MVDDEFDAFDNIELDEELLRALQDTEDRYTLSSASQVPPAAPSKPPQALPTSKPNPLSPHSRVKRWPGLPSRVIQADTDADSSGNLPEIVLNRDGSYAMHSMPSTSTSTTPHQSPRLIPTNPPPTASASTFVRFPLQVSNGVLAPGRTAFTHNDSVPALKGGLVFQSTPISRQSPREVRPSANTAANGRFSSTLAPSSASARSKPPQLKAPVPRLITLEPSSSRPSTPQILVNSNRPKLSVPSRAPPSVSHNTHKPPVTYTSSQPKIAIPTPADTEVLRKKILELQEARDAAQKALQEARQAQYIRDGEIATLRRTMEKQAAAHAESLSRLRDDKAAAENRRIAIEAEMNAEMDRLKTRFQFKQQELETASLRFAGPPSTVRRSRYAPPQSTQPTPGPSRLQDRRNGDMNTALADGSPSKRRLATPLDARSPKGIDRNIEPIPFPGFHDSFAPRGLGASKPTATTSPRSSPGKGKGKGKAIEEAHKDVAQAPHPPAPLSQQQQHSLSPMRDADRNPFDELAVVHDVYQNQGDGITNNGLRDLMEDVFPLDEAHDLRDRWQINWSEELHRVVFTHCAPPVGKEAPQLTMQLLLSTSIPPSLQDESGNTNGVISGFRQYVTACGNLLSLFGPPSSLKLRMIELCAGDPTKDSAYQALAKAVGYSVLQMANILHIHKLVAALYSLLHLIKSLVLLLPSFRCFFLATALEAGSSLTLMTLLCNCMRSFLPSSDPPASATNHQTKPLEVLLGDAISSVALDIMEALTWSIPDVQVHLLETISADSPMFMNLLSPSQPLWLIQRGMYLLLSLSLRPQLLPSFITSNSGSNLISLPYVEHMLTHLATPNPGAPFAEARRLSQSIVTFFANLCILHDKTSVILDTYSNLVPSLVLCLTDVADRFWEDDENFMNGSAEDHDALIRVMVPALCLIHHLFYGMEANSQPSLSADLPHILQQAASLPAYNGLDHTFIVTMTRLGYADVPEWLGAERVMLVDDIAEVAREMLELFVGGPEADLIVSAYVADDTDRAQNDPDEETQEEEPLNVAEIMDIDDL